GFEVFEIAPDRRVIAIGDRPDAGMAGRADGAARELLAHEIGKAQPVAAEPDRGIKPLRARLEAADPLERVIGPAGFAELAVIDDVEPMLGLLLDDRCDERR